MYNIIEENVAKYILSFPNPAWKQMVPTSVSCFRKLVGDIFPQAQSVFSRLVLSLLY